MDPVPVDEFQKFDSSIRRILKQVHPDAGLTGESYSIINKIPCLIKENAILASQVHRFFK